MQLSIYKFAQMVSAMAAAAQAACTQFLDLGSGSPIDAINEASASQFSWQQYNVSLVAAAARLATSSAADVDSFVAQFGMTPREVATFASGQVVLSRNVANTSTTVAVGSVVRNGDGSQSYDVMADPTNIYWSTSVQPSGGYVLPVGVLSLSVNIQAEIAGSAANVVAGGISLAGSAFANIDTINNPVAITNGQDAETDAAVKLRFVAYIASLSRATPAAVLNAVSTVQVNLSARLLENVNEVGQTDMGHFVVYVDDGSGNPPESMLSLVYAAVDAVRPVGSSFSVQPPLSAILGITYSIGVASGNKANLFAAANARASAYVNALPVGGTLSVFALMQAIAATDPSINNVFNVRISGIVGGQILTAVATDITAPVTTVLKAGVVTSS
jgi:hypothetical protein